MKTMAVSAVLCCGMLGAAAAEFPLMFRALNFEEAKNFPSGYGSYSALRLSKPPELKKEPKAISQHPLYGKLGNVLEADGFLLRLDQSRGAGSSYDLLIVDLNNNADLTDDPVVRTTSAALTRRLLPGSRPEPQFGPIFAPIEQSIGKTRPCYFADAYIYRAELSNVRDPAATVGRLFMRPGWCLETTVQLGAFRQKIGIVDGDCNFALADPWTAQSITNSREPDSWYFRSRDSFLQDMDGSGKFEKDWLGKEACSFGPLLYFGANPYKLTVSKDSRSLQVDAWPGPLVEVTLQPNGREVQSLTLAWENPAGQWQLIKPTVVNGKIKVPAGNYRLYTCTLSGLASTREQVVAVGTKRSRSQPVSFQPGKANTLLCGTPLEIKVTAQKERSVPRPPDGISSYTLDINATTVGAGGEIYSSYKQGKELKSPPNPALLVTDSQGRRLFSGNLAFG